MFNFFKNILDGNESRSQTQDSLKEKVDLATCVLLLEMAHSDNDFSYEEAKAIREILEKDMGLSGDEINEILQEAEKEQAQAIDFWQYANLINDHYSDDEKRKVIEMVWKVVYADGKIDKYEDYLIHKIGYVLHLSQKELIDAKLKVKNELEAGSDYSEGELEAPFEHKDL